MTKTNKSIVAIVLALVLVAVLAIGLSACNTLEKQISDEGGDIYARLDNTYTKWVRVDSYTIYKNGVVIIYATEANDKYSSLPNQSKIITSIDHVTFQVVKKGGTIFY